MIDSHTHLDLCELPNAELVENATRLGVSRMLTVGLDGASSRGALLAAESFPQVHAAVGVHPTATLGFDEADLAELRALAEHDRCAAIGETGIDLHREPVPLGHQQRSFSAHIRLARDAGKPLVVHSRDADQQTLDQLAREADGVRVLLHCFSMPDRVQECLDRGYMLSFAGNVTYRSAGDLAAAASEVPSERLLIETDAPYLAPQAVRGQPNQPAFVAHTLAFLAERRGVSVAELDATVESNAARLFAW